MDIFGYKKFEIPGKVEIAAGGGNLPRVTLVSEISECDIYPYGAHVARFTLKAPKASGDLLWLSPHSAFEEGKPIRGGIPLCFPWFGAHKIRKDLPLHGFVRTKEWRLREASELRDGRIGALLETEDDAATRTVWPHRFRLRLRVTVGESLELSLEVKNRGEEPFEFEDAFHSYFKVGNPEQCEVRGLEGLEYIDRTKNDSRGKQVGRVRVFGETIKAYMGAPTLCELVDSAADRRIRIEQHNIGAVVVWNPGKEAATANPEILAAWNEFVCVESANCLDRSRMLSPGEACESSLKVGVLGRGAVGV